MPEASSAEGLQRLASAACAGGAAARGCGRSFAAATVADTVLLHLLPIAGNGPTGWVPAFLLAGCLNIVAVAALGGIGGWLLRRRRPDLPKVVADDRAGTALVLLVSRRVPRRSGSLHRPALRDHDDDVAAQALAARRWMRHQAPAEYRSRVAAADTLQIADDLYRTCVPGARPRPVAVPVPRHERPAGDGPARHEQRGQRAVRLPLAPAVTAGLRSSCRRCADRGGRPVASRRGRSTAASGARRPG